MRILLIDDDKTSHDLMEIVAQITNSVMASAYLARDGYNLALESKFDLVLCDLLLPDINGFELRREFQMNMQLADIPFLFQTGLSAEASNEFDICASWRDDIIFKPYTAKELLTKIENLIKKP